jgi:MYXO-CTERM domain-containing protein
MKQVPLFAAPRPALRSTLAVITAILIAVWPSGARADTIRLTYDEAGEDPAATFEDDCLGDTQAEDCDARAALIEGELVTLLSQLDSDEDPETLALFQASLELKSPVVQAMALRYLSRAEQDPDDFFAKVKTFFFGPDAPLGASASAVLQLSPEADDQRLAELFDEQRPASAYAAEDVIDDPSQEGLVAACVRDTRLDLMESFAEDEQFAPADRLLMYDRFVRAAFTTEDYPVTAFATDASLDDVSAFFTQRFGEPLGPVAGSQERAAELTMQLLALQSQAASGNQDAIKKLQEIVDELTRVQQVASLDAYLQLSAIHAENDLVWLDGDVEDAGSQAMRAVTASEDPALGKTVIRYINAPSSGASDGQGEGGSSDGNGNGNGQAGAASELGEGGGGAASADGPGAKSDGGCGCAVPGGPRRVPGVAALGLVVVLLRRSVRRRRAGSRS